MKKFSFYLLLFASAWLVSCNNPQPAKPAHSEEDMIAAAKKVDAKFIEAMNSKNLEGVMSCYAKSPDLVVYSPGETELKGYDNVQKSFADFFGKVAGAKHEFTETNYKVAGDMVIGWGRVRMSMPGKDSASAPMVLEGRYTDVLAYKDSNLVYVIDHASVALPEPPPPAPASPPASPAPPKKK
jgi:ketosteroid isomerase-like protein